MAINSVLAGEGAMPALFNINKKSGITPKMKPRSPYELKLRHVFTVATYSRTTTRCAGRNEYDGIVGYGEASMPPYLQHELGTMDSVLALKKVQGVIGQFPILSGWRIFKLYADSLSAEMRRLKPRWISLA